TGKVKEVAAMLKAIHAQEDAKAAKKAHQVVEKLRMMRLARAADIVENGIEETLSYYRMPAEHWRCLRTNNPLERLMREIRRRTRVVGAFPDGKSALMLVAARLRHVAAIRWGTKRYLQLQRPRLRSDRQPGHLRPYKSNQALALYDAHIPIGGQVCELLDVL